MSVPVTMFRGGGLPCLSAAEVDAAVEGKARFLWLGEPLVHPLRGSAREAFEAAKQQHYCVSRGRGNDRVAQAFFYWCEAHGEPFIRVRLRRAFATVELDGITWDRRMGDAAQALAHRALTAASSAGAVLIVGAVVWLSDRVYRERAEALAAELYAIARQPRADNGTV
jgi:hypothetical protein